MAASSGDQFASGSVSGGRGNGDESACSTPFVSAPSSPARDPSFSATGCFYSAPASPARGGPGAGDEYGGELGFDFDFSSRCPSPAAAAMSSADELFHNGQIRPIRLASFLLRPQTLPPLNGDVPAGPPAPPPPEEEEEGKAAPADERGRFRSRSVHRRSRSLSPFRTHWLSPSSSPAPAASSGEPAAGEVAPSASRSSSSSSTASSASSSSSKSYRRWGFFKDLLLHRSKSDSGKHPPLSSNPSPPPPPAAPKRNPSPAAPRGGGRARRSAHARLYEVRRAEAEEMRRRTFLPYQQGLLFGCLGLGSRGYGAMHGVAAAAAAAGKSRP